MAVETYPSLGADEELYDMATDLVSGAYYGYAKIAWGPDGSAYDASEDTPLPVTIDGLVSDSNVQTGYLLSISGDVDTIAALSQAKGSAISSYMPGILAGVMVDHELSAVPEAEGTAGVLRIDEFGRLWTVDGGASSSYVDSIRSVKGLPDGATAFHKHYNNTAAAGAGSAATVFDPPSGTLTVVTDVVISTYGTTTGKIILYFGADADTTYTIDTDIPIAVASFAPSATYSPGMIESPETKPKSTTTNHQIKYQNDAAIDVDIIIRGYTYTP
jgi:hypothetical protein